MMTREWIYSMAMHRHRSSKARRIAIKLLSIYHWRWMAAPLMLSRVIFSLISWLKGLRIFRSSITTSGLFIEPVPLVESSPLTEYYSMNRQIYRITWTALTLLRCQKRKKVNNADDHLCFSVINDPLSTISESPFRWRTLYNPKATLTRRISKRFTMRESPKKAFKQHS